MKLKNIIVDEEAIDAFEIHSATTPHKIKETGRRNAVL